MYEQVEKPKENKSRAVVNSVGQKKGNGKQGFGFVDNKRETVSSNTIQFAGNFVGDAAVIHLHIGISSPHLKLGGLGRRHDIGGTDIGGVYSRTRLLNSLDSLKTTAKDGSFLYGKSSGFWECLNWIEKELEIPITKPTVESDSDSSGDGSDSSSDDDEGTPQTRGSYENFQNGKIYISTDDYGIKKN